MTLYTSELSWGKKQQSPACSVLEQAKRYAPSLSRDVLSLFDQSEQKKLKVPDGRNVFGKFAMLIFVFIVMSIMQVITANFYADADDDGFDGCLEMNMN